jgi:ribonuclease BN (tRNA processing enzyme)
MAGRPITVRFWGTRGTAPVSASARVVREKIVEALAAARGHEIASRQDAARFVDDQLSFAASGTYGGATSCVEIDCNELAFFMCDMGTGLHEGGLSAMSRCSGGRRKKFNFFLSHLHTDHVIGLRSFLPARDPDAEIVIHSCHANTEVTLRQLQHEAEWAATMSLVRLEPGKGTVTDGIAVDVIAQQHPGGSFGYRFTDKNGRTIVYSTDSEHKIDEVAGESAFVAFFENADLVICDTMYSLAKSDTIKEHKGHSSNVVAIDLCHQARAKRLALFHHDPFHDDDDIQQMYEDSIRYEELTREGAPLDVICSYDGLEVVL